MGRDIYNGSLLRYLHSNGASFTFMVLYLHICRSIIFQSYIFLFYTWITGIFLYLFLLGSSHPLISNSNNKITFFSYIFVKDIYGFLILLFLYLLQLGYGFLGISHPDNALEVNILVTPFH